MFENPVILTETHDGTDYRVVAEPDQWATTPDYCHGGPEHSEVLLAWDRHEYAPVWSTCQHHTTCTPHPISPETIAHGANEFSDETTFTRWLNICAPDGIRYAVTRHNGYSQGDVYLYVQAYPATSPAPTWNGADKSEPVSWARGDVFYLSAEEFDPDSEEWFAVGGYHPTVYADSYTLDTDPGPDVRDLAGEVLGDHLSDLELAARAKAARDTDLAPMYI